MYDSATAEIKDEQNQQPRQANFKLASVTELFTQDQCAKITFDGEDTPSEKEYSYLAWYVPAVGDKVLLARVGDSWTILGKVNYAVAPTETMTSEEITSLITTTIEDGKYLKIRDDGTINISESATNFLRIIECDHFEHNSGSLGFFGHARVGQPTAHKIHATSTTTAQAVGDKLDELISALASLGLVYAV
jgi:hypothetical protein